MAWASSGLAVTNLTCGFGLRPQHSGEDSFGFRLGAVCKMGCLLEPCGFRLGTIWDLSGEGGELRDFGDGIVEVDVLAFGGKGWIAVGQNII